MYKFLLFFKIGIKLYSLCLGPLDLFMQPFDIGIGLPLLLLELLLEMLILQHLGILHGLLLDVQDLPPQLITEHFLLLEHFLILPDTILRQRYCST